MAAKSSFTGAYDALPKLVKILLQVFLGWIIGGIYRIVRFFEKSNTVTLIAGILACIPPCDFFFWIIDLVTQITKDKISFLAD